ncbi:hypothetical protein [Chryseobacterium defluvii]|uniref:Uncharacterized protein n=1 Tax=Chryseobacterium defluvii TaxID=160396 RepID=A0A495SLE6_9FLAO|nr:hypothetical protein [Chryseobacterium defluvii]RKT01101.1 hypothetical protein BCF58_0315 [Chryseobacterium defluvii]
MQYPYDLFVLKITGGGIDPETGYPIPSTENWVYHSKCRDEVAVQQGVIFTESGEMTNYSSKVVMPLGTPIIEANSKIEVRKGDFVRTTGKVLRFVEAQLHCRLWV